MTDITKILEQAFADSGGVVGKAYLLDAKDEIERLRQWEERAVKSMDAACKATGVVVCDQIPEEIERLRASAELTLAPVYKQLLKENARLRENRDYWMKSCQEAQESRDTASVFLDRLHLLLSAAEAETTRLREELLTRYAEARKQAEEIERLRGALDAVTTVEGNIMELERKATQRGARMQIMREEVSENYWKWFCNRHPEAAEWFDEDGVPR